MTDAAGLAGEILARYKSIHAFCRAHEGLCRTTVYLVLRGRYPGDAARQARRIAEALGMEDDSRREQITTALIAVACSRCRARGKNRKRRCTACKALIREQATAVLRL